jgi:hypothetical protein
MVSVEYGREVLDGRECWYGIVCLPLPHAHCARCDCGCQCNIDSVRGNWWPQLLYSTAEVSNIDPDPGSLSTIAKAKRGICHADSPTEKQHQVGSNSAIFELGRECWCSFN